MGKKQGDTINGQKAGSAILQNMKFNQLENGTVSITIEREEGRQCTIKTDCKSIEQAKAIAKVANLDAVETLAKADKLSQELIRKLTVGGSMTVAHGMELWSEWLKANCNSDQTYTRFYNAVRKWYLDQEPEMLMKVTDKDLSAWVNREDDGLKAATRKVELASLRSFFRYLEDKDYLSPNPCKTVRVKMQLLSHKQKEPRKKMPFTDAEFDKLTSYIMKVICDVASTRRKQRSPAMVRRRASMEFWYAACLIGRRTGLRLGDICCLGWGCFEPTKLIVWTDKSDTRVEIPMNDQLRQALGYIPKGNDECCFPTQRQTYLNEKTRHKLHVQFARLVQGAGLPKGHTFHDLRHTRATELYHEGASIRDIGELLGHSSTEVTERYVHPNFNVVNSTD